MSQGIVTASYVGATILFILALGGLSNQETSRRGNLFGIIGITIALIVTIAGVTSNVEVLIGGLLIGGSIGLVLAKRVQMTEMPELVAILHSLVGLAAVLVGFANFMDPGRLEHYAGVELTIHDIETYLGILIGAITFSELINLNSFQFSQLSFELGLGCFISFIVAYLTIDLFLKLIKRFSLTPFVIYRILLGILLLYFWV